MIAMMLQEPDLLATRDLGSVSSIRMGSAPITQTLVDRMRLVFPHAAISNGYGTTEAAPVVFTQSPDGLPTPDTSLGVVHPEVDIWLMRDGRSVADEGVLEMRCPALMNAYHKLPEATARAMTPDGFYVTGDVFHRDAHGFLAFVGQANDMFVSGGENIYPGEVETILEAHPAVAQACIPGGVSFADAAALPCAYGTALRMKYTIGQVKAGERVLILGASGGVGVCCLQLAKRAGCEVIACAGTDAKGERLRALGADHVINYVEQDFIREVQACFGKPARRGAGAGNGVDVVVNYTGGDTWVKSLRVLKVGGRLLTCGATAGYDPQEDIRFIWTFELQLRGSNGWMRDDIHGLLELVQAGRLKVVAEEPVKLEGAADALARIEGRSVFGKMLVLP